MCSTFLTNIFQIFTVGDCKGQYESYELKYLGFTTKSDSSSFRGFGSEFLCMYMWCGTLSRASWS